MDIAIFGIGQVYAAYKRYLKNFHIKYAVDNDEYKHGQCIDNAKIIFPYEIDCSRIKFIVIMTVHYKTVKKQLLNLHIPEEKIVSYTQLGDLLGYTLTVNAGESQIELKKWVNVKNGKSVMLIAPNFAYAGVPVAMLNMAQALKNMGYHVLLAGMTEGGGLIKEIKEAQIANVCGIDIFYGGEQFLSIVAKFDLVIISSTILSDLVLEISQQTVPVLWWIHESDSMYYKPQYDIALNRNIHLYACSNRVVNVLQKYIYKWSGNGTGETETAKLYYCIPDRAEGVKKNVPATKIVFAVIGVMCHRKAQDILAQAISLLPAKYRDQFELLVIGHTKTEDEDYWKPVEKKFLQMKEVTITGELSQDEIRKQYEILDVLICPSRDDPMPVVVTEAMMYSKACIVSENVGQAEFIREQENGFVFPNENADELSERIIWVMENREKLPEIGQAARQIYEHNFTEEALQKRMAEIIGDLCS